MGADDFYIVAVERDTLRPEEPVRPIALETYLDKGAASLEAARAKCERLRNKYGKTRIAKLVFIED